MADFVSLILALYFALLLVAPFSLHYHFSVRITLASHIKLDNETLLSFLIMSPHAMCLICVFNSYKTTMLFFIDKTQLSFMCLKKKHALQIS